MESFSTLWGVQVTSGKPAIINPDDLDAPLVLNRATLVSGNEAVVSIDINNENYVIGKLSKGKKDQMSLELRFSSIPESSQTYNIRISGADSKVDLTGYFIPESGFADDSDMDELEAQIAEEEEILKKNKPVKKITAPAPTPAPTPAQTPANPTGKGKKGKKGKTETKAASPAKQPEPKETKKEETKKEEPTKEEPQPTPIITVPSTPSATPGKSKRRSKKKGGAPGTPNQSGPANTAPATPVPATPIPATPIPVTPVPTPAAVPDTPLPTLAPVSENTAPATPAPSTLSVPKGGRGSSPGRGTPGRGTPRGGKKKGKK